MDREYDLLSKIDSSINSNLLEYTSIFDTTNNNRIVKLKHDAIYENLKDFSEDYFCCGYELFDFLDCYPGYDLADDMCMPLLFSFRHSLELILKSIIAYKDFINNTNLLKSVVENGVHSLYKLYEITEIDVLIDKKQLIEEYFKNVDEIDKKSNYFRYPRVENANASAMEKQMNIDYRRMSMISIYIYLLLYSSVYEDVISELKENTIIQFNSVLINNRDKYIIQGKYKPGYAVIWESPTTFDGQLTIKDFYPVLMGYIKSARFLYYKIVEENNDGYFVMCYFYRHSLELIIKYFNSRISKRYKEILEAEINETIKTKIYNNHQLNKNYYRNVTKILRKWAKEKEWETETIDRIEKIVNEVANMDNNGDIFRYPINKAEKFYEYNFDCIVFAKCVDYVIETILNCTYQLDEIDDILIESENLYIEEY